jgi:glycosyltransferase involved in cell wall biosynthesis
MTLVTSKANPIWHFRRNTSGPRRIVHVPPRFASANWSGADADVLALAQQQLSAGMEPVIISTMMLSDIRHEIVSGIRVQRHPNSYYFFGSGETQMAVPATEPLEDRTDSHLLSIPVFQSLMQEPEVRLFHTHALGRLGSEVRNAARMRFRPFVATVHGSASISTGTLIGSRKDLADAHMVIFMEKREAMRASSILGHDRIAHLAHGVDCARFTKGHGAAFREQHGIPRTAFIAGCFAELTASDARWLLEACAEVVARRRAVHLLLKQPGTDAQLTVLQESIQQLQLGEHVHLAPAWERHDAKHVDALHACDVLIQCGASHEDVLVAWSAGKPIIAHHSEKLAALVRDYETGLLCEPDSPFAVTELASYLERLTSDEALRQKMGEQGRAEALAHHDWSRVHAQLEEIYQLAEKHHQITRQQQQPAKMAA